MKKTTKNTLITLLSSGLIVAIFTFVSDKTWQSWTHHAPGPKYVNAAMRVEGTRLLLFVRNNSDEPLDLVRANIVIDDPSLTNSQTLGAYPDVSKIYDVSTTSGSATLEKVADHMVVKLKVTQAIAPKEADQFGVALSGIAGPVDLSKASIHAEIEDIKGSKYQVRP